MVLVLCIGDTHIPDRATDLPAQFRKLLVPGKIHHVLCTGNLNTKEMLDSLKSICGSVHITKGDCDEASTAPEDEVLAIGDLKIGLCHGHQVVPWGDKDALAGLQRRLGVDILVTGHTHKLQTYMHEDCYFINPGSATGAYSTTTPEVIPSFVLMDVDGSRANIYIYRLKQGESGMNVDVEKLDYQKPKPPAIG